MSEIYPGRGTHNRTKAYELDANVAFRTVELPFEVEEALGSYAQETGYTPLAVLDRFVGEWTSRHQAEIDAITEEVDTGQPYDEWRRPKEGEHGSSQQSLSTVYRYLIVNHEKLSAILGYAQATETTPAQVTEGIILESLQVASA